VGKVGGNSNLNLGKRKTTLGAIGMVFHEDKQNVD